MALLDHEGGAEFPYHKAEVFKALEYSISKILGMKIVRSDVLSGHIYAKAGISLFTWGENIPITVTEISFGRTRVSITSTPKTGLLLGGAFDFGKNRRNIESIITATSKLLSRRPPVKIDTQPPPAHIDPVQRMEQLKQLLKNELITEEEFERKKTEIVNSI